MLQEGRISSIQGYKKTINDNFEGGDYKMHREPNAMQNGTTWFDAGHAKTMCYMMYFALVLQGVH